MTTCIAVQTVVNLRYTARLVVHSEGLISTPFGTSNIYAISSDDLNIYCGADSGKFAIYNKSSGTFGGLGDNLLYMQFVQ